MKNPVSIATENFIKTVYQFGQKKGHDTRPGSIARELGISNAAATDMARKLARKDLIHYEKYKELRLTPSGSAVDVTISIGSVSGTQSGWSPCFGSACS